MTVRTAVIGLVVLFLTQIPIADQVHREDIALTTNSGLTLRGEYFFTDKPGPGIILFHMCNGIRTDWSGVAEKLAMEGFHVMAYNYRGYGDSEGDQAEFSNILSATETWSGPWREDAEIAYATLRAKPNVIGETMGAAGASCGVHMSIQLAQDHPDEVKALALLAGPASPAVKTHISDSDWLPVFAAYAKEDGPAPRFMNEIVSLSEHPDTKLVAYEGDAHGTDLFAVEDELEPLIVNWFVRHLLDQDRK